MLEVSRVPADLYTNTYVGQGGWGQVPGIKSSYINLCINLPVLKTQNNNYVSQLKLMIMRPAIFSQISQTHDATHESSI